MPNQQTLQAIMASGGSVVVPADSYTPQALQAISASGKNSGGRLTLTNAGALSQQAAQALAASNPGGVTFDFTR